MPLLDIATAQPYLFSFRSKKTLCHSHHATFVVGNVSATTQWIHFSIPDKPKRWGLVERRWRCGGFVVKAVATVEPSCLAHSNGKLHLGIESSTTATEEFEDVDDKELLRRDRISKANAGKKPWNKGRKHSPETRELIRERTRLAMQNPKIRMKLQSLGHAQSEETKIKIGDGVRKKWQKRNEKQMLQETCRFEWESLVAEASRKGFCGEEELQWNSYKILEEQLTQEWLDIGKQRKASPGARGNKRAPKSLEQRRRISAAIAAKWADPEYRSRVSYGLNKYHDGRVRKPRKKAPSGEKPKTKGPANKAKPATNLIDMQKKRPKFRSSKGPSYKDPLASSKFEMLKNIKAQRAAVESNKSEAITRAKLLIAEAQNAAQALEIAAASSPLAQASLLEARKLIAEAMESIWSIDPEYPYSDQIGESSSFTSPEPLNHVGHEPDLELEASSIMSHEKVNGFKTLDSSDRNFLDYDFSNLSQDLLERLDDDDDFELAKLELEHMITHPSFTKQFGDFIPNGADQTETGEVISQQFGNGGPDGDGDQESMLPYHLANIKSENEKNQPKPQIKTKKWVRGKLVEVEGD